MLSKILPVVLALAVFSTGASALAQDNAGEQREVTVRSTFPIPELGNCGSKEECKTYCDAEGHGAACLDYAAANGLMSADEIARARTLMKEHEGPGGCQGKQACRAYCNDAANRDECARFAAERGLTPPRGGMSEGARGKAQEAKIRAAIIKNGSGPGGCTSFTECHTYCEDAEHRSECVKFAEENGIGSTGPRGLERAAERSGNPRVMELLRTSGGPGGCKSETECKAYCEGAAHMEECLGFAEENGLMSKDETQKARMFMTKTGPGGCKGPAECEAYCAEHQDECRKFRPNGRPNQSGGDVFENNDMPPRPPCSSPAECESLCKENPERCAKAGENVRDRMKKQFEGENGRNVPAEMLKAMSPDQENMRKVRDAMQRGSGAGDAEERWNGPMRRPCDHAQRPCPGDGRPGIAPPIGVPGGELPFREGPPVPVGPGFDPSSPPVPPTPAPSIMPPQPPVLPMPTSMDVPVSFTASVYAIFSRFIQI